MSVIEHGTRALRPEAFREDPDAARFASALEADPAAFAELLAVLNDVEGERALEHAARRGEPALRGILADLGSRPALVAAVTGDGRFRQAVGVAVRLKMERLGWRPEGRGAAGGPFRTAARYVRADPGQARRERAIAALDRIAASGTAAEHATSGATLVRHLAETRAAEGRPF